MELILKRHTSKPDYTIGALSLNGEKLCDTMEGPNCWLDDSMRSAQIHANKKGMSTAIPKGRYILSYEYDKKYDRSLPHIKNVKTWGDVLIHFGYSYLDVVCGIVIGECVDNKVHDSVGTCERVFRIIRETIKREEVWITIS